MSYYYESVPRRRRRWPLVLLFLLVGTLAIAWSGLWVYATTQAETTIAGWREREARVGRIHDCATQTISGFPFRIEVRCSDPVSELRGHVTITLKAKELLAAVQV